MPGRIRLPTPSYPSSGSAFADRIGRIRPATPDIDRSAEIMPDWRKTRDVPIIRPGQLGGAAQPGSLKKGGKVKKTGLAKVHKGERVLSAKAAKKVTPAKLRAAAPKRASAPKNNKVKKTMHEFKAGTLRSGSKTGPKVKSRRQAVAIALSQARRRK